MTMASKQPIVKQIDWISIIPQLCVMGVIFAVVYRIKAPYPIITGALIYLALSISLRHILPAAHRRGIALFKKQDYKTAIPEFQKSYDFFFRHQWIDHLRYLVLLSSSRIGYREMSLLNIAYCYGQIGEGAKSRQYYEKTLTEFPKSEIAKAALKMFESAERIAQQDG
jgi:tetratricopeptide (TPR) repeat protein